MLKEERKEYIDILNVISCLAVVLLHTNNAFWRFSYDSYWISANFIECIFYFAVPVFYMITGATIMNYREKYSTKTFFKKRCSKTVIPFVIWSVFAVIYFRVTQKNDFDTSSVRGIIDGIVNTKYVSIYWFFVGLFAVYLSIPVLSLIPKENRNRCYLYIVITAFVLNYAIPFVASVFPKGIPYNSSLKMFFGDQYIFYALCGWWIDNIEIKKKYRYGIYAFGLMGVLIHIFGTWYLSYRDGMINGLFKGYMNVPCILYSMAVFLFVKNVAINGKGIWYKKIVDFYNSTTFGVYLIHWYFIDTFLELTKWKYYEMFRYRFWGGVVLFLVMGVVVKNVQKIRVVKKYILP